MKLITLFLMAFVLSGCGSDTSMSPEIIETDTTVTDTTVTDTTVTDTTVTDTTVSTPNGEVFLNKPFTGDFKVPFDFFINLEIGSYILKVTGVYGVAGELAMDAAFEWRGQLRKHGMWSFNGDDGRYGRGIRPTPDVYNDAHVYYYHFVITEQQTITIVNQDDRWDDNSGALTFEIKQV